MPRDVVCEKCGNEARLLWEEYWIYSCPKCGGNYKPLDGIVGYRKELDIKSDIINDLVLALEFHLSDYPFDEHHILKQRRLIERARKIIGNDDASMERYIGEKLGEKMAKKWREMCDTVEREMVIDTDTIDDGHCKLIETKGGKFALGRDKDKLRTYVIDEWEGRR